MTVGTKIARAPNGRVRKLIALRIDMEMLDQVDEIAAAQRKSRSLILEELLTASLKPARKKARHAAIFG